MIPVEHNQSEYERIVGIDVPKSTLAIFYQNILKSDSYAESEKARYLKEEIIVPSADDYFSTLKSIQLLMEENLHESNQKTERFLDSARKVSIELTDIVLDYATETLMDKGWNPSEKEDRNKIINEFRASPFKYKKSKVRLGPKRDFETIFSRIDFLYTGNINANFAEHLYDVYNIWLDGYGKVLEPYVLNRMSEEFDRVKKEDVPDHNSLLKGFKRSDCEDFKGYLKKSRYNNLKEFLVKKTKMNVCRPKELTKFGVFTLDQLMTDAEMFFDNWDEPKLPLRLTGFLYTVASKRFSEILGSERFKDSVPSRISEIAVIEDQEIKTFNQFVKRVCDERIQLSQYPKDVVRDILGEFSGDLYEEIFESNKISKDMSEIL